jgi:hypothetical protein
MSVVAILLIVAVVCFALDALKVQTPVNLFSLGWAFAVASVLVGAL